MERRKLCICCYGGNYMYTIINMFSFFVWQAYKGSSELIDMAEASIQSLPYHLHLPLVSELVKLSSSMYVS